MSYAQRIAGLMQEPSTDASEDQYRHRRVELSRGEMMHQGDAIRETLAVEREKVSNIALEIGAGKFNRIVIVGCGDSLAIGIACRAAFEYLLHLPMEAQQALDFALYGGPATTKETLVIGLSASGTTEAVKTALSLARSKGARTIAVCNKEINPLQAEADYALTVRATREGWPTQSSTAAIALLCSLAAALAESLGTASPGDIEAFRRDLEALPALVDQVTVKFDGPGKVLAERFAQASLLLFCGAGSHFAAASFGSSKIKELSPIHAISMSMEEYHHYRSQKEGDVLFLVAPDAASRERALDTALVGKAVGGHTVALIPEGETEIAALCEPLFMPAVRPELAPILYSVPLHLFSYHFAKERFARKLGHTCGLPVRDTGNNQSGEFP